MTYIHKNLSPSSAARRVKCPGSFRLENEAGIKNEISASKEGDAAHWVASNIMQPDKIKKPIQVGTVAPNGEIITEEMLEGAILWHKTIYEFTQKNNEKYTADAIMRIEKPISIATIHPNCSGTPDLWVIHGDDLYIFDYKFGHSRVDAFENWQLLEYAAGILESEYYDINVHLIIVRPRFFQGGKIDSWTLQHPEQTKYYFDKLRETEALAMAENSPCVVSTECKYCTARGACRTLQESTLDNIEAFQTGEINILNNNEIGSELRLLHHAQNIINSRINGLEQIAEIKLKQGELIEHYFLENSVSALKWQVSDEEILNLSNLLNVDLIKDPEPITPTQAIKELKKAKVTDPDKIINNYAKRFTSVKLKQIDVNDLKRKFINSEN